MKKYLLPTLTIVALCLGFGIGFGFSGYANAQRLNGRGGANNSKLDQLMNYISTAYVDEMNTDSLTEIVMTDLVDKLDPHSAYIPAEDLAIVNSELESSFSGIGVQFSILNDTINIVSVISGGPSEGVGVLAGDKIIYVDDSLFVGKSINNEKVMHTLRGPKDTQVKVGIRRAGTAEILPFTITRGDIPVHTVDAAFLASPKIGFVRVSKFGESTYAEFMTALTQLKGEGAQAFIVDLRENSGGYMEQTIKMANEFLSMGDMIVYSEGRAYPRYEAKANGMGRFQKVPLVVLIDDFSASASEIFAGAMQDNDRALIIGRRSFGKGLVQQQVPFEDGSALRLTVARYYTPSGRCIQKPYELGNAEGYETDLINRFEHGEFYNQDSIHFADTTAYYTKGGKKVFGGGGIMPDIFIGRDTLLNTPWSNQVVNYAYTYQFALQYADAHRAELLQQPTWQKMEAHLKAAHWFPNFVQFCTDKGIEPVTAEIHKSQPMLERLVNAYIVRNILGDEGFFPLLERDDPITQRAVQELQK